MGFAWGFLKNRHFHPDTGNPTEGWKTDGTKGQGKFTLKKGQKGQHGIHHLTSEGEELIQTLRRNWAKVTRDPVSSLAQ